MPCPHCSKSLKVRSELVGRSARCPYCRSTVTVTAPEERMSAPAPLSTASASTATAPPSRRLSAALSVTADVDVAVMWHILVGVLGTALFYLALWPIAWSGGKMTYVGRLFIGTSTGLNVAAASPTIDA
ncbi:MAG: hypothetical protein WCJ18_03015, partial [Planctomycetota bacterium]